MSWKIAGACNRPLARQTRHSSLYGNFIRMWSASSTKRRQKYVAATHQQRIVPACSSVCRPPIACRYSWSIRAAIPWLPFTPAGAARCNESSVAAVHAGWRGTLQRIVQKTIGRMQMEFGSRSADLIVALGPAIGGCCYEVGTEVASTFTAQFANAAEWFDELRTGDAPNPLQWLSMAPPGRQPPPKNVLLDLRKANRWQLLDAGVREENIFVSNLCTACRSDLFFSYRKEGPRSGRLMAVVGLRESLGNSKH